MKLTLLLTMFHLVPSLSSLQLNAQVLSAYVLELECLAVCIEGFLFFNWERCRRYIKDVVGKARILWPPFRDRDILCLPRDATAWEYDIRGIGKNFAKNMALFGKKKNVAVYNIFGRCKSGAYMEGLFLWPMTILQKLMTVTDIFTKLLQKNPRYISFQEWRKHM